MQPKDERKLEIVLQHFHQMLKIRNVCYGAWQFHIVLDCLELLGKTVTPCGCPGEAATILSVLWPPVYVFPTRSPITESNLINFRCGAFPSIFFSFFLVIFAHEIVARATSWVRGFEAMEARQGISG